MQLIIITPEEIINGETVIINKLFENGLQRLHIRKPSLTSTELKTYIDTIAPQYHKYLVLHSCFELFNGLRVGGIHLSSFARADPAIAKATGSIPYNAVSTSFHSWQEIVENHIPYGYVFISPVFDSISKAGYMAAIDLSATKPVKKQLMSRDGYAPQIIGLGGVTGDNLSVLHQYGFDGGAMLGDIWQATDPVNEFANAMKVIQELKGS